MFQLRSLLRVSLLVYYLQVALALIPPKDLKPNVFVLSDISNEPDDAESFVRLLLYTNELNLKGIVLTTSTWLNDTIHDQDVYPIIDAYEVVYPNLLKHSDAYPPPDYLRSIVSVGKPVYGLAALDGTPISPGARNLVNAIDASGDEPFYVLAWGGASVVAEALNEVLTTRNATEVQKFISNVTLYTISDQDDAGPWIRYNFPALKYIASIHAFNYYGVGTWIGISGDINTNFDAGGPDTSLVTKQWLQENIRSVGPLGAAYPELQYIMEGDTPTTLFVLPNGLNVPEHPEYGGWGGRYNLVDRTGRYQLYSDTQDRVIGKNNVTFTSNKATIWRWREAYQNDFAARIQWTVKNFDEAVHQPVVVFQGSDSVRPVEISATVNTTLRLDLSGSYDLNGRPLKFEYFPYRELTGTTGNLNEVPILNATFVNEVGSIVDVPIPDFEKSCYDLFGDPIDCKAFHFIAKVSNDGTPSLTTYKRFIIQTVPGPNDHYVPKLDLTPAPQ